MTYATVTHTDIELYMFWAKLNCDLYWATFASTLTVPKIRLYISVYHVYFDKSIFHFFWLWDVFLFSEFGKKLVIRFFFGMVLPIAPLRSDRHGSFTYSTGLARKALSLPIFFRVRWATPWMPRQGENWGFRVCTKKSEKSIQKLEWWGKGAKQNTAVEDFWRILLPYARVNFQCTLEMSIFASDQWRQWDGNEDFFRGTETEKRTEAMEVLCFHHFIPLMFQMPADFSWLVPQFQFGKRLQYVSVLQWSWCMKTFILLTKQSSHKMLQLHDISFVTVGLLSNSTPGKQKILFGKNNMFIRQDISKMHFPASSLIIP